MWLIGHIRQHFLGNRDVVQCGPRATFGHIFSDLAMWSTDHIEPHFRPSIWQCGQRGQNVAHGPHFPPFFLGWLTNVAEYGQFFPPV